MNNTDHEKRSFSGPNSTDDRDTTLDNSLELSVDTSDPTCLMNGDVCPICAAKFSNFSNLKRHVKSKHPNESKPVKNKKVLPFQCCDCPRQFSDSRNLAHHRKTDHQIILDVIKVPCPFCAFEIDKDKIIKHYQTDHNVNIESSTLTFETFEEFTAWKKNEENDTCSKYSTRRIKNCDDTKTYDFLCHRSGFYHPSVSDRKRTLKSQGSYKVNHICPAKLNVILKSDGKCTVNYVKTHVGHKTFEDLGHISLSSTERQAIAEQIALKVPLDTILDNIRNSITESNCSRMHLISMQDLHNIEKSFNICSAMRHKEDGVSVESWVREMEQGSEESCVLFYKPQGIILKDYPMFKEDDFCLMIMNETQQEMLRKFGSDCICMDSTHGLNPYDLELTTLLVIDEFRQGFPCAFMFSKSPNEDILRVLFSKIKERMKDDSPKPKVFMSDMADCFFNAWEKEMEMAPHGMRLYCTWHVDRAWRKNLCKIKNEEKRAEVYKILRTLLIEQNEEKFNLKLDRAISYLFCDSDTAEFAVYFNNYYKKCKTAWAYCYRLHSGINTNMHLESMHRTIKHIYLNGRSVKRLDKAIYVIMKLVRNRTVEKFIALHKGKLSSKVQDIRKRHNASLQLNCQIIRNDNDSWSMTSSSSDDKYIINRSNTARCECEIKCADCQACLHTYSCSCIDSAIRWNMCKHIHYLCQTLISTGSDEKLIDQRDENDNLIIDEDFDKNKSILLEHITKQNKPCKIDDEKNMQQCMNKLQTILRKIETQEGWRYVMKTLNTMDHTISALNLSASSSNSLKDKSTATKRKIDVQRRIYSTKKKRKKSCHPLKKPDRHESSQISANLLTEDDRQKKGVETANILEIVQVPSSSAVIDTESDFEQSNCALILEPNNTLQTLSRPPLNDGKSKELVEKTISVCNSPVFPSVKMIIRPDTKQSILVSVPETYNTSKILSNGVPNKSKRQEQSGNTASLPSKEA